MWQLFYVNFHFAAISLNWCSSSCPSIPLLGPLVTRSNTAPAINELANVFLLTLHLWTNRVLLYVLSSHVCFCHVNLGASEVLWQGVLLAFKASSRLLEEQRFMVNASYSFFCQQPSYVTVIFFIPLKIFHQWYCFTLLEVGCVSVVSVSPSLHIFIFACLAVCQRYSICVQSKLCMTSCKRESYMTEFSYVLCSFLMHICYAVKAV